MAWIDSIRDMAVDKARAIGEAADALLDRASIARTGIGLVVDRSESVASHIGETARRGTGGRLAVWLIGTEGFDRDYAWRMPAKGVIELDDFGRSFFLGWIENLHGPIHHCLRHGGDAAIPSLPVSMRIPPEWSVWGAQRESRPIPQSESSPHATGGRPSSGTAGTAARSEMRREGGTTVRRRRSSWRDAFARYWTTVASPLPSIPRSCPAR